MRRFSITIDLTGLKQNKSSAGLLSRSPRKDLALLLYCLCRSVKMRSIKVGASFRPLQIRWMLHALRAPIRVDDIFSGVFSTPDGDLLEFLSDEDVDLNVTLSSTSSSEGWAHIPFAQYAVLRRQPRYDGRWRPLRTRWTFLRPRPGSSERRF